jgi:competence protein ComEC
VNGYYKYTPLRIAVPFILGIASVLKFRIGMPAGSILLLSFVCFPGLIISYYFFRANFRLRWMGGFFANLSLFFLGACLISTIDQRNSQLTQVKEEFSQEKVFLCRIEASPVQRSGNATGNATIIAEMDSLGQWHPLEIRILVYFKNDSLCKSLGYGDIVLISCDLQAIPGPTNPHMFNYRQYLINRQVFYQVFLEPGQWRHAGRLVSNPILAWAEICREKFLETLRKFKVEGQEFALASALLLGTRDFLGNDIIQEFSHAGAIHVLSVSGLHVGIMYVVADRMLFFLKRGRRSRKLHQILIILSIWAYAFITGLPSSVVRAALMFSLIAVGKMFKRSSEGYNILAVAAFFQLWINPYEITQVGFQLSYLAVLGIFAFYTPLNDCIIPYNKLISWVWSILAVSMAAQLATFPLACYYFNMFPVYFLVTNLIVVPLAAVVTYFAVALLVVGAAGLTFEWLAWPLNLSLRFMIDSVDFIQSWPGAVIEPVIYSQGQVIAIYTAIIALFAWFVMAYRKWAFIFLGSCLVFSVVSTGQILNKLQNTEIVVYQVSGHTAIDFIHKNQVIFICDSLLREDTGKIDFQVKPNRTKLGISDVRLIIAGGQAPLAYPGVWISYPFITFRGKRIAIIDNNWRRTDPEKILDCDLVIISGNPGIRVEELKEQTSIKQIIIDSSVPFYRADQLIEGFQKEGIPCHYVRQDGAFVMKW